MGVAAFVTDEDGHVLMIRENYGAHRYGFPDGEVEAGESLHDALLREFREEACAEIDVDHVIALDYRRVDSGGWWLYALFACRLRGAPKVPDTGEIAEILWIDPANPPTPLTFAAGRFLERAAKGDRGVVGWLASPDDREGPRR